MGLGTVGASVRPCGTGSTPGWPVAPAERMVLSHSVCSGERVSGAVGPTGLPKIQLMPTRIRLMPMTAMMVPVTTGGKKRSMRLTTGAIRIEMMPAPMMAPNSMRAPSVPGLPLAIATIGPTAAKVTPIITGRRMPNHCVAPSAWIRVAMPQQNRSAEIRKATSCGPSLSARPTISGTATAPAYITSTCCSPRAVSLPVGRRSSTGWTAVVLMLSPEGCRR